MPALNEEDNILFAVDNVKDSLKKLKHLTAELVLINDGSVDRTLKIMQELQLSSPELNIKIIEHTQPMGIGASFWDGVQNATGDAVVLIPSDGEIDAHGILKYLDVLAHVDMIIPFVVSMEQRTLFRRLLSKSYTWIINMCFGTTFSYTNGTVVYRRSILKNINLESFGFFYQTELIMKCAGRKYFYAEVPYMLTPRLKGKSTAVSLKNLLNVIKGLINTWLEIKFKLPNQRYIEGSATYKILHQ